MCKPSKKNEARELAWVRPVGFPYPRRTTCKQAYSAIDLLQKAIDSEISYGNAHMEMRIVVLYIVAQKLQKHWVKCVKRISQIFFFTNFLTKSSYYSK